LYDDFNPIHDWIGVSAVDVSKPVEPVGVEGIYFSFDEAKAKLLVAVYRQIARDDARDDFIEEKLHRKISSKSCYALDADRLLARIVDVRDPRSLRMALAGVDP
jgi:hypothetical protein